MLLNFFIRLDTIKAIKYIGITLLFVILFFYLVLRYLFSGMSGICGNTIIHTSISPNHKYKLVLFQRDCGATTGFSSQISLLNYDEKLDLETDNGNIYIAKGYPNNFKIIWVNNYSVIIKRPKAEVYKMKKRVNNISFTYLYSDDNKPTQTPTSSK